MPPSLQDRRAAGQPPGQAKGFVRPGHDTENLHRRIQIYRAVDMGKVDVGKAGAALPAFPIPHLRLERARINDGHRQAQLSDKVGDGERPWSTLGREQWIWPSRSKLACTYCPLRLARSRAPREVNDHGPRVRAALRNRGKKTCRRPLRAFHHQNEAATVRAGRFRLHNPGGLSPIRFVARKTCHALCQENSMKRFMLAAVLITSATPPWPRGPRQSKCRRPPPSRRTPLPRP